MDQLVEKAAEWAASLDDEIDIIARSDRQQRFNAAFTPNNALFSGHLPTLTIKPNPPKHTPEAAMHRHYYASVLNALELERVGLPAAPSGGKRIWITGSAENATTNTFIWEADFSTSALLLLDPATFRCVVADVCWG